MNNHTTLKGREAKMTHQQLYDKIKKTSKDAYIFSETIHFNHGAKNNQKIIKTTPKKALIIKSLFSS